MVYTCDIGFESIIWNIQFKLETYFNLNLIISLFDSKAHNNIQSPSYLYI